MPLLADYAITPDVFDVTSYSTDDECAARIETMREVILTSGLVRNLCDGAWQVAFESENRAWHRRGRELTKKLAKQGRLVLHPSALSDAPADDSGWCTEALATHELNPFAGGVIVTKAVKERFVDTALVFAIDRLGSAPWWDGQNCSVRLARTLADYEKHLTLALRYSNSLMFIDPHLDPEKPGYQDFAALLQKAAGKSPPPLIEIHRVCYEGSGPARQLPLIGDSRHFKRRFHSVLAEPLHSVGLNAKVFIWDDFHDRYLISNLAGISLSNGFDTSRDNARTTWARLGNRDRDEIQQEFDRNSRQHKLVQEFEVP